MAKSRMRLGKTRNEIDIVECDRFLREARAHGWGERDIPDLEALWWKTLPLRKIKT